MDTPLHVHTDDRVDGYTLHVHTAGGEKGYTFPVYTAGGAGECVLCENFSFKGNFLNFIFVLNEALFTLYNPCTHLRI